MWLICAGMSGWVLANFALTNGAGAAPSGQASARRNSFGAIVSTPARPYCPLIAMNPLRASNTNSGADFLDLPQQKLRERTIGLRLRQERIE